MFAPEQLLATEGAGSTSLRMSRWMIIELGRS